MDRQKWKKEKEWKKKDGDRMMSSKMKRNKAFCPHQPHGAPELPALCCYFTELICVTGFTSAGLTLVLQEAADLPVSSGGPLLAWSW